MPAISRHAVVKVSSSLSSDACFPDPYSDVLKLDAMSLFRNTCEMIASGLAFDIKRSTGSVLIVLVMATEAKEVCTSLLVPPTVPSNHAISLIVFHTVIVQRAYESVTRLDMTDPATHPKYETVSPPTNSVKAATRSSVVVFADQTIHPMNEEILSTVIVHLTYALLIMVDVDVPTTHPKNDTISSHTISVATVTPSIVV